MELCTYSKDYRDTGIHLHDMICGSKIYLFDVMSGTTAGSNKVKVAGWWLCRYVWLPDLTDWAIEKTFAVYDISDYCVTKLSKD